MERGPHPRAGQDDRAYHRPAPQGVLPRQGYLKVSVVIPTLNAGPLFGDLLQRVFSQKGDFDLLEVVVVDSGSTDGTTELAKRYGARVHGIPRSEFGHGATRNLGISLTEGELVVLTVQDAVPVDERWLAAMVESLERDERVAGVYGRQVPHGWASPLTRLLVSGLASAEPARREQSAGDPALYRRLKPRKRRAIASFDNVSSCVRRSVWEELPFETTRFGEDLRWGKGAVEAGFKIVYEPRSAVYHSHERGFLYDLRRHYADARVLSELFGIHRGPSPVRLGAVIVATWWRLYRSLRAEGEAGSGIGLGEAANVFGYVVSAQLGSYLGGVGRDLARRSPRAFRALDRYMTKGV